MDRAVEVARGLDHHMVFEGCDAETRDNTNTVRTVAPGLRDQLGRLVEQLTVPSTSATVRHLTQLQVFKRWIATERRDAAQRFANRSLFQRFIREPHFLSAW